MDKQNERTAAALSSFTLLIGLLTLAVLAGACGEPPAPAPPSTSPSSAEPAAEPGPTEPAPTAPARTEPAGPRAFPAGSAAPVATVVAEGEAAAPAPSTPSAPARPRQGPVLELAENEAAHVDFGRVIEGDKLTHIFHLRTAGTKDVVVSNIRTPCKCTRARMFVASSAGERKKYEYKTPIAPGTPLEVEVDISSDERAGSWTSHVIVYSDDPTSPLEMKLDADVDAVLDYEPSELIQLGEVGLGQVGEGHLRLSSEHLPPFKLSVDTAGSGEVFVGLTPVDPTPEGKARIWDVAIQVGPMKTKGWQTYPLHLVTDVPIPWPKIKPRDGSTKMFDALVHVQAQVEKPYTLEPRMLSFGQVSPGSSNVERSTTIRRLDGGALPAARAASVRLTKGDELDGQLSCTTRPVAGENALELVLRLAGTPEGFAGSFQGFVDVDLGEGETIPVRFAGACQ